MTAAVQGPLSHGDTLELSKTLFRKQILKAGSINYKGQRITFDEKYLTDLAASFKAGAYDTVPFLFAEADNAHTMAPERIRGDVVGMEVRPDGLYGLIELSEDAATLVKDYPKLGVSARIVPDLEQADGRKFNVAVQHVLGTIDPRVTGMKPWEAVELSSNNPLVDLTAATYETEGSVPDNTLTDDEVTALKALLAKPTQDLVVPSADDQLTAEEAAALAAALTADEPVLAGADLSADARQAIDLANADADQAKQLALNMRRELWSTKLAAEVQDFSRTITPAVLDLAKPLLYGDGAVIDDPSVIELSNTPGGVNVADQVRKILAAVSANAATVNLSAEHPFADRSPAGDNTKALLDMWDSERPFKGISPAPKEA